MYLPRPIPSLLLLLALSTRRGSCAPAYHGGWAVFKDVDYEKQAQLGAEALGEHVAEWEIGNLYGQEEEEEEVAPLDSVFPDTLDDAVDEIFTTPTRSYSTLLARRLLALSSTGVLTTVFPRNISDIPAYARTPADVAGVSIGLPEYVADCEDSGDATMIALGVSTSTKNVRFAEHGGRNVSLSVSWWEEYAKRNEGRTYWAKADLPRLVVLGALEEIPAEEVREKAVEECFVGVHGDSRLWIPGRKGAAHQGVWVRLRVKEAYWIGGFGGGIILGGWMGRSGGGEEGGVGGGEVARGEGLAR